jgi:hypothetical protein
MKTPSRRIEVNLARERAVNNGLRHMVESRVDGAGANPGRLSTSRVAANLLVATH